MWTELPVLKSRHRHHLLARNGLKPLLQIELEASRGEVKSSGNDGEESEADDLDGDTRQGDVLAMVQPVDGIGVGWGCAGNHDGTDELEEQRDDIATDEDGSDPASYQGFQWVCKRDGPCDDQNLRGAHSSLAVLDSAGTTWNTMRPKVT